jgi:hypothetical protein|tara:strand:+ start:40184 stop:40351 length:168 start_codon:yes stop_codon:yes gene_type:complete
VDRPAGGEFIEVFLVGLCLCAVGADENMLSNDGVRQSLKNYKADVCLYTAAHQVL